VNTRVGEPVHSLRLGGRNSFKEGGRKGTRMETKKKTLKKGGTFHLDGGVKRNEGCGSRVIHLALSMGRKKVAKRTKAATEGTNTLNQLRF